jgi:hypothetical protein
MKVAHFKFIRKCFKIWKKKGSWVRGGEKIKFPKKKN